MAGRGASSCLACIIAVFTMTAAKAAVTCAELAEISDFQDCNPGFSLDKSKLIIMVQVGDGYSDFFQNWYKFASRFINSQCMQLVAVVDDEATKTSMRKLATQDGLSFQMLDAQGLGYVPNITGALRIEDANSWDPEGSESYEVEAVNLEKLRQSGEAYGVFQDRMAARPTAINTFLKNNCPVLFSDIDLVWRKDLFRDIKTMQKGPQANAYFQSDNSHKANKSSELVINGGLLYLNPRPWTLQVIQKWVNKLAAKPGFNQGPLNEAIREVSRNLDSVTDSVVVLPYDKYLNGHAVQDGYSVDTSVSVHADFVSGKHPKIEFLKAHGLWKAAMNSSSDKAPVSKLQRIDSNGHTAPIVRHA